MKKGIVILALCASMSFASVTSAQITNLDTKHIIGYDFSLPDVILADNNDDGIMDTEIDISAWSRLYGYLYNGIKDNHDDRADANGGAFAIPEGLCMDKTGLPAILDVTIPDGRQKMYYDTFVNPNGSNRNYIKKIVETRVEWDMKKFVFNTGEETMLVPVDSDVFEYSIDGGKTWVAYLNRDDVQLKNECVTNVRFPEAFVKSFYRGVVTYNMKVKNDKKVFIHDQREQWMAFGWTPGTLFIGADGLTDVLCAPLEIKINVLPKDKVNTPPQPTPELTRTPSGPGGYVDTTPIKTEVEPPKPTISGDESSQEKDKETPKPEAPKPETPSFSMDFKEVVTQVLPKLLPKMGAFTGSSRSGNGMVRDNHGILRSAKDIIKLLDTKINSRDFRLAGSTHTELSHWLQVLDSHEKNMDKYVVIPSVGLVMPIADVAKTDKAYKNFLSGKTEHFYDYAGKGAVGIPDVGNKFGENGNKIIAGHSSWWKDDASVKYKTHFQKIINLKAGTEIWVYEKNTKTGEYTRHVYQAEESYNTSETDVSILKQTKDSTLTLFTCTPVGGDIGRWVVKAKLVK